MTVASGVARSSVLFVEFVTVDRFHCALHFPHARGLLRHLGHEVRWLRFALRAAVQYARDEVGIGLPADETATLVEALRATGATHVLFSHQPAASLLGELRSGADAELLLAVFGSVAGLADREGGLTSFDSLNQLQRWLGAEHPIEFDVISPAEDAPFGTDYGFEPANEAAREMQPFVFVLAGHECSYLRSLEKSELYGDLVEAGEAPPRFGCTFCRRPIPDGHTLRGLKPVDWAVAQVRSVAATHPPSATGQLSVRVVGERVVQRLERFAAAVADVGLAPTEFLIDTRSDGLVRWRGRIAEAADILGRAGHRLEVSLIGVESFVAADLERFNKGLGPETNLAAIRVLRELERDHPQSFGFRKYGGLSTILYTPWSTLEDVALNLAVVRHFRLQRICGKILTSRARLYEELPLAALARRDGLLVDAYDDPALDTARRNFYAEELPWRFQDARVERFNRIATRLQTDEALAGEALYEEVQRWRAAAGGADEIELAERLCAAVERAPDCEDLFALVAAAEEGPRFRRSALEGPEGVTGSARSVVESRDESGEAPRHRDEGPQPPADSAPRRREEDPLLVGSVDWRGFVAGIKPVCRLEPLTRDEVERVSPRIREVVPEAVLHPRRRDWNDEESYELFVGRDRAEVDELVGILEERDAGLAGEEGQRHVYRTGELLGYARCCVERFSQTPEVGWLHNEWLHVRNRVESPAAVPTEIRPLNGPLSYVTCSATCEESLAKAEILRARGDESVAPAKARWPMLFLLDRPAHFAVLEPLTAVGERFRYRLDALYGDDERLAPVADGDELEIVPGQIRILRDGAPLAQLSLNAYVWWHERAFHPEFWAAAVEEKLFPIVRTEDRMDDEPQDQGQDAAVPEVSREDAEAEEAARVPRLDQVLGWMKRYLTQAGLPCRAVLPTPAGDLDIVLRLPGGDAGLRWRNQDAPADVVSLLGAPLVPLGKTSVAALQRLAPLLQERLAPAWERFLRDRLDRGNREHREVCPGQGIRFLVRKRMAVGRPLWGAWSVAEWDEELGADGVPRSRLVITRDVESGGSQQVVVHFGPAEQGGTPFFRSRLGALWIVDDGRSADERRTVSNQIERPLGFHFARAVPADAVWGPPPAPEDGGDA